jgi:hypothetical protein
MSAPQFLSHTIEEQVRILELAARFGPPISEDPEEEAEQYEDEGEEDEDVSS